MRATSFNHAVPRWEQYQEQPSSTFGGERAKRSSHPWAAKALAHLPKTVPVPRESLRRGTGNNFGLGDFEGASKSSRKATQPDPAGRHLQEFLESLHPTSESSHRSRLSTSCADSKSSRKQAVSPLDSSTRVIVYGENWGNCAESLIARFCDLGGLA